VLKDKKRFVECF